MRLEDEESLRRRREENRGKWMDNEEKMEEVKAEDAIKIETEQKRRRDREENRR